MLNKTDAVASPGERVENLETGPFQQVFQDVSDVITGVKHKLLRKVFFQFGSQPAFPFKLLMSRDDLFFLPDFNWLSMRGRIAEFFQIDNGFMGPLVPIVLNGKMFSDGLHFINCAQLFIPILDWFLSQDIHFGFDLESQHRKTGPQFKPDVLPFVLCQFPFNSHFEMVSCIFAIVVGEEMLALLDRSWIFTLNFIMNRNPGIRRPATNNAVIHLGIVAGLRALWRTP